MIGHPGGELITILKVADKWQFDAQKQAVLEVLRRSGTSAEKIVAGRMFPEINDWIVPAFIELASRCSEAPPSETEARPLGALDLLRVWHAAKFLKTYLAYGYNRGQVVNAITPMLLDETVPIDTTGSIFNFSNPDH